MFEARIKKTEPMTVSYLQMQGPYHQIPLAMGMLYGWMNKRGLAPIGAPLGVYLSDPQAVPESEAVWEVWVPVAGSAEEALPDAADIGIKKLPVMTVATTVHVGPYEDVAPAYEALAQWVAEQGYVPSGPPMEAYLSDPDETPPEGYETEIIFPVEEA